MKNLRICVIGLGAMGRLHLSKLLAFKDIELIGVEKDQTRRRIAEINFHISVYESIEQILNKIDAAILATPTSTHFHIGSQLLKNGIHTFIEKPLAENSTLAYKLMDMAIKNRVVLQVGHIERFNPSFVELKKRLKEPKTISFYRLSPFPDRSMDIDVVMDLMIHDIDLLLKLNRSKIKSIVSSGFKIASQTVDIAYSKLSFEDGMTAHLISNRVYNRKVREIIAIEMNKYFLADLLNFKLTRFQKHKNNIQKDFPIKKYDQIEAELRSFINSVVNKVSPEVSAFEAYQAISLAEKIQKKMFIV